MLIDFSILYSQPIAFPGADGYGKFATGGRGGKVIEVTNLNDNGPGSLRAGIDEKEPRIIIFRISGTIALEKDIVIENGDLTIAGQTAPGDGVCIKNFKTEIKANNVILRYLRFRLGDETKQETDALGANNSKSVIIDHCSTSWAIDENASFYNNENFTLQWCIISESLNHSYHKKGPHGYGGIWGGLKSSFHHNLFAHNSSRNPRFQGARTTKNSNDELVDFRNNVIYNWGFNSAYGGEMGRYNMIANYYKAGPATICKDRIIEPWDEKSKWFVKDNFVFGYTRISSNNWNGGVQGKFWSDSSRADIPFAFVADNTQKAEDAYIDVLKYAGAIFPKRDPVDTRIVKEVKTGKATFDSQNYKKDYKSIDPKTITGIIDSQKDVGGWPFLRSKKPPVDTDHDGIPDKWEISHKLNPKDPTDANFVNKDGYTNLEKYLNEVCQIKK
jgi:pectate lyase